MGSAGIRMIIEPGGGLGNRLLTISSAFNLAKDCGINDIILLWRNNNECGCDFEDVLDRMPMPCKVKTLHFGKESYKDLFKRGRILSILYKIFHGIFYKIFREWAKGFQLPIYQDMPTEEQMALKDWVLNCGHKKVYIEGYYTFYGNLDLSDVKFNKELVRKAESFKCNVGAYDAMHIRRTDNAVAIKNSPTELFYQKIEDLLGIDSNRRIYIATDDKSILDDLKKRYSGNIISAAKEASSRSDSEGMKFALYEMLILAGADTIYASYGSTFTVIANVISGNKMITLKT